MDQHPMGHKKRKPTTLATNMEELFQLDGLRGEPSDEARVNEDLRALPLQKRMQESKTWSAWADGLKAAISTALNRHLQRLQDAGACAHQPSLRPLTQVALESWKQHFLNDHLPLAVTVCTVFVHKDEAEHTSVLRILRHTRFRWISRAR